VFWVISVYFNIRNTLPKSGTFLLGHPVYTYIYIYIYIYTHTHIYIYTHTHTHTHHVTLSWWNRNTECGGVTGQDRNWKINWFGLSIWLLDTPKIYVRYNIWKIWRMANLWSCISHILLYFKITSENFILFKM